MNQVRLLAAAVLLLALPAIACEEPVACDQCAKYSEFSWNPSNQFMTPRLQRFYELDDLVGAAYKEKRYEAAKALITEYVALAKVYRCNWNYGNAVHDSHRVLGLMLLEAGDVDGTATALLEAGKSTGSPQLNTFGPDLDLANELLKRGKKAEVAAYLNDIRTFWKMDNGVVDDWLVQISSGEAPELNKHRAREPGPLQIAAFYLALASPLLVCLGALWVRFNRVPRKVAFLLASILLAYLGSFVAGWGSGFLSATVFEAGWISTEYVMHWAILMTVVTSLLVPLAVVFASLKAFGQKAPYEGT